MQTRLLKPIDLTPAESASRQQLAHPDRDDLMGVALLLSLVIDHRDYVTGIGDS